MAYTSIDQLTWSGNTGGIFPNGTTLNIEDGSGNFNPNETLYYGEDIKKVIMQPGVLKIEFLNVKFERDDSTVSQQYAITVLGAKGKNAAGAEITFPLVALPWQPYYHTDNVDYQPGSKLLRNPDIR